MVNEVQRAKLKKALALRSQFNYNVGLQRIDFNLETIAPALDKIQTDAVTKGIIPEFLPEEISEISDSNKKS